MWVTCATMVRPSARPHPLCQAIVRVVPHVPATRPSGHAIARGRDRLARNVNGIRADLFDLRMQHIPTNHIHN